MGMLPKTKSKKVLPDNVVEKPWGHELLVVKNDLYVVKQIFIKAGHSLSKQYHKEKTETLICVSGNCFLTLAEWNGFMTPHLPYYIAPNTIHRLEARETDVILVEVSTTELDDVVRLEDKYGRSIDEEN